MCTNHNWKLKKQIFCPFSYGTEHNQIKSNQNKKYGHSYVNNNSSKKNIISIDDYELDWPIETQ